MLVVVVFAFVSMAGTASALAGGPGHRARLSEDLADHVRAGSQQIDVIVHATRAEAEALALRYQLRIKKYMKSGVVFRLTAGQLAALQEDETVDHLSADIPIHSIADVTAESIGADQVWAGIGSLPPLSGKGIGVAVIDSGIDPKHAALKSRVVVSRDFTGGDGADLYGHGTHVAGIIAGQPGRTVDTEAYQGIAAGARIVNLRVLDERGAGFASDVIEAIDWAVENRKLYDIHVINLSLGAPVTQPYRDDPICEAVERAVASGIVVVVAAGNYGMSPDGKQVYGSIATPGNDPNVITVGALDTHDTAERSDDTIAKYSSRGPTRFDLVLKPDLVAPGNHIVSAEAAGSYLSKTYPQRHVAGTGANAYFQLNGTSMAAGVVSGTVALILDGRAHLSPRDIKAVLQLSSTLIADEGLASTGAGSLNALAAAELATSPKRFTTITSIAGEGIWASGLAYSNAVFKDGQIVWDSGGVGRSVGAWRIHKTRVAADAIVWDTAWARNGSTAWNVASLWKISGAWNAIVWDTSRAIVWDTSHAIVWDTSHSIVWDTAHAIVWDTSHAIVWDTSDAIVWDTADAIVWDTANAIVWDTADAIVWDTSTAIVWDTSTAIVWDTKDAIAWDTVLTETGQ